MASRKRTIFLLLAVTLVTAAWPACRPSATPVDPAVEATATTEVVELAKKFQDLRKEKGHFSGGDWNDALDSYGGQLHTTMVALGELLGQPAYARTDIVRLMGEPDAVRSQKGKEHLIYFWRGWHDYLYFVCQDDVIQEAKWYFAYE